MKIEVFNPCGSTEAAASFAPRLTAMEGKTIGLLSNGHWQAGRTFPYLRDLLSERFPSAKLVLVDGGYGIDKDPVIDGLIEDGCDAVIVGHAA